MRVISAEWGRPIEGPPIEDGAVEIEAGRIATVGSADELGAGLRYDDSVILPGFVNAHTHLEYAVYGGFGDGLGDFAEWITLHIHRKARIGRDGRRRLQLQRRDGGCLRRSRSSGDGLPRGLRG